jgi:hypothetical protein
MERVQSAVKGNLKIGGTMGNSGKAVLILILFLIIGCLPQNGKDGTDGGNGIEGGWPKDPTTDEPLVNTHTLSGRFEKGKCMRDGEVLVWPLFDGTLTQTGQHFVGFTGENGNYEIRGSFSSDADEYALVYSKVDCNDEANGGEGLQELYGVRAVNDINSNVNPLTKISMPVAEDLFDGGFGTVPECLDESERLTLEYLGMPAVGSKFGEMTLAETEEADAVLALTNSMVLYELTPPEQGDFMKEIATGIIQNDPGLKAQINAKYGNIPSKAVRANLLKDYETVPPFWRIKHPPYYADLWERTPEIKEQQQMDVTSVCNFDQSTYNTFAVPVRFTSLIESSRYLAAGINDGDVSIWTVGAGVPGEKLLDVEKLREILIVPELQYNGKLGEHSLTAGDYYIVLRKDTDFVPSKACQYLSVPFGFVLASDDEGATWIGDGNTTPFFRSGLKLFTTD